MGGELKDRAALEATLPDFKTLLDDFGLSVVTWRNSKKGDRREVAHRESIAAKRAVLQAYDGLRRLADEYDACIRHMDAGGDFHEFMAARAREFDAAQQAASGTALGEGGEQG